MTDKPQDDQNIYAGENSIAFGSISVGGNTGEIHIGHTIGFTSDQVSTLLTQISTTFQPKPFDGRCPYKGLDFFEEEDAGLFFGRERLVADLVSRVKESRTVFITGPSGSGKSSLVRAGLIHVLKDGVLKGSDHWLYETMKPGRDPIKELSLAFSRLKSPELANYFQAHATEVKILNECAESVLSGQKDQRFLLFVDQFEEVFTQISQEEERQAFINMLAYAGTVENGRVIVLFAMRSDFVSNCATYPALNELLSQEFRQIGAMQPEELVAAIALPAKEVGLPIEEELIARIINDMKGEPGALPLMQFALKDLFDAQQAKGGVVALTLEDYLKHGGIQKSLERHADASLAALDEEGQLLARSIFSGLIEIGRGTADTKRTALFDELVPANASTAEVLAIVQKLADARLIITDEQAGKDTVTISHEKLIEAWPWLKKLVNENRDVIALQNEISAYAKEWDEHKRDPSYLYTGARLANVGEQLQAKKLVLSGLAYEYVQAGSRRKRRSQMTLIAGVAAIIALLFATVIIVSNQANIAEANRIEAVAQKATAQVASTFAVAQAEEAQKQTRIARAGELTAQSNEMQEKDFQLSTLLGIEAFRLMDTPRSQGGLLEAANSNPQLLQYISGFTSGVLTLTLSPDGRILALGRDDGTVILWDIIAHQPIGEPLMGHMNQVISLAFSPDGKTLASGTGYNRSGTGTNTIILWDVETYHIIGQPIVPDRGTIYSIAFSPDGNTLASGDELGTISLWDVRTFKPIGKLFEGHKYKVNHIAFSPDGQTLASGSDDTTIILWDVVSRTPIDQPMTGHTGWVTSVTFSPDGKFLASGSEDKTVILWDVKTRQPIGQPLREHTSAVNAVAFSPDGRFLASGSSDTTIILWDVSSVLNGDLNFQTLKGHKAAVYIIAFSPDKKTIVSLGYGNDGTGTFDNVIIVWDVETHYLIGQPLNWQNAAFSPDGKTLALGGQNNTIILWNIENHKPIGQPLRGYSERVLRVAFSPDGETLASVARDGTIMLWNVETRKPLDQQLEGQGRDVTSVAFSPDGKYVVSGNNDYTASVWEVQTGKEVARMTHDQQTVSSVAFSPDGKYVVSGSSDNTARVWEVTTGNEIARTTHDDTVTSVAFSPDGKYIVSGSCENQGTDFFCTLGTARMWEAMTGKEVARMTHDTPVTSVAFSPNGKILASGSSAAFASQGNTIVLWDVQTRQPIGQSLQGHSSAVSSLVFSPDGKTLVSGGEDDTIILWNMSPEHWIEQSCQRAGRNFTRAEWTTYLPDKPYPTKQEDATCPQWPLEPEGTPATPTP